MFSDSEPREFLRLPQKSHFGGSKCFSTAISVQKKHLQIAIRHLYITGDHLAISGGILQAPWSLNPLKQMFCGDRHVFQVGKAPSGPTLIRLLRTYIYSESKYNDTKQPFLVLNQIAWGENFLRGSPRSQTLRTIYFVTPHAAYTGHLVNA